MQKPTMHAIQQYNQYSTIIIKNTFNTHAYTQLVLTVRNVRFLVRNVVAFDDDVDIDVRVIRAVRTRTLM